MQRSRMWAVALVLLCASVAGATELVGVPGSSTKYPTPVERPVGDKPVKMVLTGTALRTKAIFNVYAVGSYVKEGSGIRTAEQLAAADLPKQLHLVMERDVAGKDMAEAFAASLRRNYPEPAFNEELGSLLGMMRSMSVKKGEHVLLTHVPGVGLHCELYGKQKFLIKNVKFAQAVWEIYFGQNNLGEHIKRGLTSRL